MADSKVRAWACPHSVDLEFHNSGKNKFTRQSHTSQQSLQAATLELVSVDNLCGFYLTFPFFRFRRSLRQRGAELGLHNRACLSIRVFPWSGDQSVWTDNHGLADFGLGLQAALGSDLQRNSNPNAAVGRDEFGIGSHLCRVDQGGVSRVATLGSCCFNRLGSHFRRADGAKLESERLHLAKRVGQ